MTSVPKHSTEFASDLGWGPGHFPKSYDYCGVTFRFVGFCRNLDGDIEKAVYRYDGDGVSHSLIVYND